MHTVNTSLLRKLYRSSLDQPNFKGKITIFQKKNNETRKRKKKEKGYSSRISWFENYGRCQHEAGLFFSSYLACSPCQLYCYQDATKEAGGQKLAKCQGDKNAAPGNPLSLHLVEPHVKGASGKAHHWCVFATVDHKRQSTIQLYAQLFARNMVCIFLAHSKFSTRHPFMTVIWT